MTDEQTNIEQNTDVNRLVQERIRKLNELKEKGVNPYPYSFDVNSHSEKIKQKHKDLEKEEKTDDKVRIAGRIMSKRGMGKATFMHIQDHLGRIQAYVRESDVGKDTYKLIKKLDIGDFAGISGNVFKTKMGEISVYAETFEILTKTLKPLPEKYHGLKDTEIRYRKRYLDLIMNQDVKDVFVLRSKIIKEIRNFLDERGFIEVETPILQPQYGGANARPFTTHHNTLNMPLYLKISPELYLKRLIVGGFNKVYDMTKNFRNEGIDKNHNPEFTMLEWYEAYTDYEYQMKQFEDLVSSVAQKTIGTMKINYLGTDIDLTPPWKRVTMIDALKEYAKIDVSNCDVPALRDLINQNNLDYDGETNKGHMIAFLFEELVEEKLIQPTFVIDHPIEISPLTKEKRGNPSLVERFEPFIYGMEIGNAYSELNDPIEQRKRLELQDRSRSLGDEEAQPMDEDFVESIEVGMPPTGGVGLGVDRVIMLITNQPSIKDIILFPAMRPEIKQEEKKKNEDHANNNSKEREEKVDSLESSHTGPLPLTRDQAIEFLKSMPQETSDINHYLETEVIMKALAKHFDEDVEYWGMLGLLHDVDWSKTKDDQENHTIKAEELLKEKGFDDNFIQLVQSHAYGYPEMPALKDKQRTKRIEHALIASETLTGIIYAYALLRDGKISDMKVKGLKKRFEQKAFARNCNRELIKEIEKTGLELSEFFQIAINAVKEIAEQLNLK